MVEHNLPAATTFRGGGPAVCNSSFSPDVHDTVLNSRAQLKPHQQNDAAIQLDDWNYQDSNEVVPTYQQAVHPSMPDWPQLLPNPHDRGRNQYYRKKSALTGSGYSYAHVPRLRNGDQQSDPRRRRQLQMNYMDSLALRIPNPASFSSELQEKENLRILLVKFARETLESYAETRGCHVGPKSIDLKCAGSLRNGMALPGAELDLVLITYQSDFPECLEIDCLRILQKAFSDNGFDTYTTTTLKRRAPLLQLRERYGSEVLCNVDFSGSLAIYSTELLRCYALCDDRIRLVATFVKMWAKARKISRPFRGTMCSYGYILMVIHYLVNVVYPPLAPNLQLAGHGGAITVDGYNVEFFSDKNELRSRARMNAKHGNRQSVGDLLRGFFAYYGSRARSAPLGGFDWIESVVSIRTPGGILPKQEKGWTSAKYENERRISYLLAVEDPFEHDHNVAWTISQSGIRIIRTEFNRAHTIINRVQDIPGVGWEWRDDNGDIGEDFLAEFNNKKPDVTDAAEQPARSAPHSNAGSSAAEPESRSYQFHPLIDPAIAQKNQRQQERKDDFQRHPSSTIDTMRRLLQPTETQNVNPPARSSDKSDTDGKQYLPYFPSTSCHRLTPSLRCIKRTQSALMPA